MLPCSTVTSYIYKIYKLSLHLLFLVSVPADRGAEINARNTQGETGLMFAAKNGQDGTVDLLLLRV